MNNYKIRIQRQIMFAEPYMVVAGFVSDTEVVSLTKPIGGKKTSIACETSRCLSGGSDEMQIQIACMAKALQIIEGDYAGESLTAYDINGVTTPCELKPIRR